MGRYPADRTPLERTAGIESRQEEGRRKRVPLGVPRAKLDAPQREGYVRRWVVDRPGRLGAAEEGGYAYVSDKPNDATDVSQRDGLGSKISRVVGTYDDGKPMMAYLMEIKKEWYEEDQKAKSATVDKTESALRRGKDQHGEPGKEGRYVPQGGISIESKGS